MTNKRGGVKTAIKQEKGGRSSYSSDKQQAYYLHRAGAEETWFTNAGQAITYWESNGGQLFVGRTPNSMTLIRG